jgi:hypothetical protein
MGKDNLDPRMTRGAQQGPLWWYQAGIGHRTQNHKEPGEVGHLAASPEPLGSDGGDKVRGNRVRAEAMGRDEWSQDGLLTATP